MTNFLLKEDFYDYLDLKQVDDLIIIMNRLGFNNESVKNNYLLNLYNHVFNDLKNKKKIVENSNGWRNYYEYSKHDFAQFTFNSLRFEANFRSRRPYWNGKSIDDLLKNLQKSNYVSATDISSFLFCPVSYCIKNSFDEDEPLEEARVGTELHEQHRLVALMPSSKRHEVTASGKGEGFYSQYNFDFFDDVRSAKIYYVGHDKTSERYFKSSKGHLVRQPDYVFTNRLGVQFVVEEKFRPLAKYSTTVRQHHRAQLASYILGLDEIGAEYGYLVYWYYAYESEKFAVKKCVVFKVEPTIEDREAIRGAYKSISALNVGKRLSFNPDELSAAKCVNCVVRKFCGHKTGRFNEIVLPYGKEFYSLFSSTG